MGGDLAKTKREVFSAGRKLLTRCLDLTDTMDVTWLCIYLFCYQTGICHFPFGEGDEIPDDYEVENYATGQYQGQPALTLYEGEQVCELLVME